MDEHKIDGETNQIYREMKFLPKPSWNERKYRLEDVRKEITLMAKKNSHKLHMVGIEFPPTVKLSLKRRQTWNLIRWRLK